MEVHARPRACAAKYSRSIEVSRVRFETHVRQRRRSRVSHLESRAMRLREQAGAQLLANRAHPLDPTACLQLLERRQTRSHRHRASEVGACKKNFQRRLLQTV